MKQKEKDFGKRLADDLLGYPKEKEKELDWLKLFWKKYFDDQYPSFDDFKEAIEDGDVLDLEVLDDFGWLCFEKGCLAVIKEIEKLFYCDDKTEFDSDDKPDWYLIRRKEWEVFKHGKKE